MPSRESPIQPTPFDAAKPAAELPGHGASRARPGVPRLALVAVTILALLVLAVFFWLPTQVSAPLQKTPPELGGPTQVSQEASSGAPPVTSAPAQAATEQTAPWNDGQQARMRKDAQDLLEKLLNMQFELENAGVKLWAAERFAQALEFANKGDELYRQQQFANAQDAYHTALTQLESLQADLPQLRKSKIAAAVEAVESRNQPTAIANLDLAELMDPTADDLSQLRLRSDQIPAVIALLHTATTAEAARDIAGAVDALSQALALDPDHRHVSGEHKRLTAALAQQSFNAAMSDGYAALNAGQFDVAGKAFTQAQGLRPGSTEVAEALTELANTETSRRLSAIQSRATNFEAREQWREAVAAYKRAISIDSSVLFAREGLTRSKPRAELDSRLRAVLDDPKRLEQAAIAREAQGLLEQARQTRPQGKVLTQQIERLTTVLQKANTPISITLHSDMETEVTIYTVARLGRFLKHNLALRPGTYTALGTRIGYRDVRQEFTVSAERTSSVSIVCSESVQ